jgi:tetratricopeptide (TPR) repeat protein
LILKQTILILTFLTGIALSAISSAVYQMLDEGDYSEAIEFLNQDLNSNAKDIEAWRMLGFSYRQIDNPQESIVAYKKVLEHYLEDYDARLAVARLYLQTKQYRKAEEEFQIILNQDPADVEAYLGLARSAKAQEDFQSAIHNYQLALQYLPDFIPTLLELATVYSYSDQLGNAIKTYNQIIEIDATWSEAWAGLGRMYWWSDKPFTSQKKYKKALQLDPENMEFTAERNKVKAETKFYPTARFSIVEEREDAYTIASFNQKYTLKKRFSDLIEIQLNSFLQYNQKERKRSNQTHEKWFDNHYLKTNFWLHELISVNFTAGASSQDSVLTVMDGGVVISGRWRKIKIRNSTNAGEEYFNHWENLSRIYLKNNLQISWNRISFSSNYTVGKVEESHIWHDTALAENPFVDYTFGLNYLLYEPVNLKLGASHRFMDYQYNSSQYYTPADRSLIAMNVSLYYPYKKIYAYASTSAERDNNAEYGYSNDLEFGLNLSNFSLALGYGNFKNPYYESDNLAITISGRF